MPKKDKYETPGDSEYKKGTALLVTVFGLAMNNTYTVAVLKILNLGLASIREGSHWRRNINEINSHLLK